MIQYRIKVSDTRSPAEPEYLYKVNTEEEGQAMVKKLEDLGYNVQVRIVSDWKDVTDAE